MYIALQEHCVFRTLTPLLKMPINDLTTTCSLLENSKALNVIFTGHPGGLEMKALTINCIIPDLCPVRGPMSHVLSHLSTIDSLIKMSNRDVH